MNRRHLVVAAAVLLGVLAVAGCTSMGAKDQAVIDPLEKLDIVAIPAGATKMSSTQTKGGGSDVVAIRGASSVLVVYASPLPAARIREFYQQTYDKSWDLRDIGAAPPGNWRGISGANRSDPQTNVEIRVRPPAVNDKAPTSTRSVVSVTVSATRSNRLSNERALALRAAAADGATNKGLFGGRPTADQAAVVADASPNAPAVFTLNPEGGDVAVVNVHLPVGVTAEVKVARPDGTVDATATVTATQTFGEPGYLVQLTALAGANRVVTVTPSAAARTEFSSTVLAGTVSPTAAVEMDADGQGATIRVTAPGLTLQGSSTATVQAAWLDGDQRKTIPLVFDAMSGQFTARFTPPPGIYVPVDVTFNADGKTRVLTAGVVIPDGSGTIGALEPSALLDTDADGTPDVFRIPINTTVSKAGSYQIAADLSRDGKVVMSERGTAQLQPGSGQILLDIPVASLLLVGQDGPFQVTSVLLTEGSGPFRNVAESDLVGTTGPLNLAELTTANVVLSRPAATSEDTNHDGLLDLLRFSAGVAVPKSGDYLVSGTLLTPTGKAVSVQQSTVSLTAGRTGVNLDFNGKLIGANGDGVYSLAGLTITEVSNPANTSRLNTVLTPPLDSTLWTLPVRR